MNQHMNCQSFSRFVNIYYCQARKYNTKNVIRYMNKSHKNKSLESVVGLEIHAQISSRSKLFSAAGTDFNSSVNSSVSFFDSAIPGTLPVLNKYCVESAALTALALSCTINPISVFDRKHYFYADLPAGYQITQQRLPLAFNGKLEFPVFTPGIHKNSYKKISKIKQIQLEQDSGKSLHDEIEKKSLVDLNRAGIPLMELVFEPDLKDGEEAAALVKELILILQRLGTSSCKMEEGALRVDANVSMHFEGDPLGVRTELKNLGSVKTVSNAVAAEINRQRIILLQGGKILNETRAWDSTAKCTVPLRDKEEKQDYRFMPEPNLPPLHILVCEEDLKNSENNDFIRVKDLYPKIPELPEETREFLKRKYEIKSEYAIIFVNEEKLKDFFLNIVNENTNRNPKKVANLIIMEFLQFLNKGKKTIESCSISYSTFGELVDLIQNERINLLTFKNILQQLINGNNQSPTKIMKDNNWEQISDPNELNELCLQIIIKNSSVVQKYKNGKVKVLPALIGEIAKESNNRANMKVAIEILKKLLEK